MRAKEFVLENLQGMTISIPINITFPIGGGMPSIGTIAAPAGDEMPDEPVMVPPLQQELELMKQQGGKLSKIINQIVSDNGAGGKMSDAIADKQEHTKRNYFNLAEDFNELAGEFNLLVEGQE
jgi:hypothetical protein